MSLLDNLFGGSGDSNTQHPCSNCPSNCPVAGSACSVCQPYKEKLIDAIYRVEHFDEVRDRYVVSSEAPVSSGAVTCPYCGGPSENRSVCDYCGMSIGDTDDKIYVQSAADIPNPILEAQDLIYERISAVGGANAGAQSSGLLGALASLLSGGAGNDLGAKMTEAEIVEASQLYGVTVAEYLNGLDQGVYLPLAAKRREDERSGYGYTNGYNSGYGYNNGYNSRGYGAAMGAGYMAGSAYRNARSPYTQNIYQQNNVYRNSRPAGPVPGQPARTSGLHPLERPLNQPPKSAQTKTGYQAPSRPASASPTSFSRPASPSRSGAPNSFTKSNQAKSSPPARSASPTSFSRPSAPSKPSAPSRPSTPSRSSSPSRPSAPSRSSSPSSFNRKPPSGGKFGKK